MEQSKSGNMNLVLAGCMCFMLAIASHGLALATIQGPVLERLGGQEHFALITILSSVALCLMTPVGGKLTGELGPGKLILIFGTGSIITGLLTAFTNNLAIFMVARVLLSACQGAYASLPYIIVNTSLPRDKAPKWVGYLTMMASIGSVGGSFLAGWFEQNNMPGIAMSFPLIFIVAGTLLIALNMPKQGETSFHLDWGGIVLLAGTLGGILLGLNNGPILGWYSLSVVISFFVGFVCLLLFIAYENKVQNPLMPMSIFKVKEYSLVLFGGFLYVFNMIAISNYLPLAAQKIMGVSSAASGMMQLPKAVLMLFLPAIAGSWVVKKTSNIWKALAIAGIFLVIPFGLLVFVGPKMPYWFMMGAVALTAVSEAYRSVGLMPAVQLSLPAKDIAVGTSLVGFVLTLSSSVASAFFGLVYNSLTSATPGLRGMIDGIDTINLLIAFVSFIGVLLTVLFLRPMLDSKATK